MRPRPSSPRRRCSTRSTLCAAAFGAAAATSRWPETSPTPSAATSCARDSPTGPSTRSAVTASRERLANAHARRRPRRAPVVQVGMDTPQLDAARAARRRRRALGRRTTRCSARPRTAAGGCSALRDPRRALGLRRRADVDGRRPYADTRRRWSGPAPTSRRPRRCATSTPSPTPRRSPRTAPAPGSPGRGARCDGSAAMTLDARRASGRSPRSSPTRCAVSRARCTASGRCRTGCRCPVAPARRPGDRGAARALHRRDPRRRLRPGPDERRTSPRAGIGVLGVDIVPEAVGQTQAPRGQRPAPRRLRRRCPGEGRWAPCCSPTATSASAATRSRCCAGCRGCSHPAAGWSSTSPRPAPAMRDAHDLRSSAAVDRSGPFPWTVVGPEAVDRGRARGRAAASRALHDARGPLVRRPRRGS